MANVITHNISAINTLRNLNTSNRMLGKSLQKLSSGYRINTGADGPADLVISEKLRAQSAGLERAVRNTQEAMNVIGIAEGALNEMNDILKSIRQLAIHAANSGVTSGEQVAADQAEVDSSIQTIDRIANTTKYSSDFLLNGAKQLSFTRSTLVDGSMDHALIDIPATRIEQIDRTSNFEFSVGYTGSAATVRETQAARAYFEAYDSDATDELGANTIDATKDQKFTLTGNKGSKSFSFAGGTQLGDIVTAINNASDSTGVQAKLVMNSSVAGVNNAGAAINGADTAHATTEQESYCTLDASAGTAAASALVGSAMTGGVAGQNCDKNGFVWVKWIDNTNFQVYKDKDMTMLVGDGQDETGVASFTARNSSGLGGFVLTTGADAGDVYAIAVAQAASSNSLEFNNAALDVTDAAANTGLANAAAATSIIHGIDLGTNTDSLGRIYVKMTGAAAARTIQLYKSADMNAEDLIAESVTTVDNTGATSVDLVEKNNSGIFATLLTDGSSVATTQTGFIRVTAQGVRIYSEDYGSDAFVKVDQSEGSIWRYVTGTDTTTKTLLQAGTLGNSAQVYGQNATLTINGQKMSTSGLTANVSTSSVTATVQLRAGEAGMTTIAQQGYNFGGVTSKINSMETVTNYVVNARKDTSEILSQFRSGMQFQLGEGAGSQERTVYSIQSMAIGNLGRTSFTDDFGSGLETKNLTLEDVLAGGLASLANDPIKALQVIDKAISDVSELRARLGAFQKNMLQTNANSLNVAIENITSTESDIRDANMAAETTEFTKNQILVQAGTAMLAQANVSAQNVLQLLG